MAINETYDASRTPDLTEAAKRLNIPEQALLRYGREKAKIDLKYLQGLRPKEDAKLILVTAISPTPAGEGKTTTSIGLADGLTRLGYQAALALREPSMGPVFGMKGGATGGGKAVVIPQQEINLHFTGDFAAIAQANNLLAALTDNHLHHGNQLRLDSRQIKIRRCLDLNDRALRNIVVGLGGPTNGVPREAGFDITAASQVMATFCLATSLSDLKARLGRIVVGLDLDGNGVTADDLQAAGPMTAILRDALAPNLVRTAEGTPTFIHGGPFANIAHGCSSVMATKAGLSLAEYTITEAGFGADLGAEKFFDIKCRMAGVRPTLTVLVATVRALKYQAGVALADLSKEDVTALREGSVNLLQHLDNLRQVFGQNVIVAINHFQDDTAAEIAALQEIVEANGASAVVAKHFSEGSAGTVELAQAVVAACAKPSKTTFCYDLGQPLEEKILQVVQKVYHGASVTFAPAARKELKRLTQAGWGKAPVCIAKTQYSFSTDAKALGAPQGFEVNVREVRLSAGAGFVVAITGSVMTMPGLPAAPKARQIDVDEDANIVGMY